MSDGLTPPGWLDTALGRCFILCAGCGIVSLSARFGPVEDDEDARWDWAIVVHHGRDDCPVLADDDARCQLNDGLDAELGIGDYCEPEPLHTAVTAP